MGCNFTEIDAGCGWAQCTAAYEVVIETSGAEVDAGQLPRYLLLCERHADSLAMDGIEHGEGLPNLDR